MLLSLNRSFKNDDTKNISKGCGSWPYPSQHVEPFANHLENFGEPLIRAPKVIDNVLYATCWSDDHQLSLDLPDDEPPPADMTIREFRQSVDSDADHWDTEDYDQPIGESFIWDIWPYQYSASAAAFYFLSAIDLGVMTSSAEAKVGYIDFVEGPSPRE